MKGSGRTERPGFAQHIFQDAQNLSIRARQQEATVVSLPMWQACQYYVAYAVMSSPPVPHKRILCLMEKTRIAGAACLGVPLICAAKPLGVGLVSLRFFHVLSRGRVRGLRAPFWHVVNRKEG